MSHNEKALFVSASVFLYGKAWGRILIINYSFLDLTNPSKFVNFGDVVDYLERWSQIATTSVNAFRVAGLALKVVLCVGVESHALV